MERRYQSVFLILVCLSTSLFGQRSNLGEKYFLGIGVGPSYLMDTPNVGANLTLIYPWQKDFYLNIQMTSFKPLGEKGYEEQRAEMNFDFSFYSNPNFRVFGLLGFNRGKWRRGYVVEQKDLADGLPYDRWFIDDSEVIGVGAHLKLKGNIFLLGNFKTYPRLYSSQLNVSLYYQLGMYTPSKGKKISTMRRKGIKGKTPKSLK